MTAPCFRATLVAVVTLIVAPAAAARAQAVQVINMIPVSMSDEASGNGEPYLAVNPANPQLMAATAFMATPAASPNGPMLVSTDGGTTWAANNIIPSNPSGLNTFDVTIRFNSAGTALYLGMLRDPGGNLEVARTTDMTLTTAMTVLASRPGPDQPYIATRTVTGWFDAGKDRVWVGNNDGGGGPTSATIDQSLDAGIAMPVFTQIRLDKGAVVDRDNYQTRPVASADGHIYAAFYRRKGAIAGFGYNADVVVVRDDNWGKTMPPFENLVDTVTVVAGQNIVVNTPVSDTGAFAVNHIGKEWWGGDLFLTVDPNDSSRVYISYSDSQAGAERTLHLRRSTTHGQTWDPDLLTIPSAKNAAIAVNSQGKIAYLYQSLTGVSPNRQWETHLRRSSDGVMWDDVTLATFPGEGPNSPGGDRIIGDYLYMMAVGKNFYGVFSSYNHLVNSTFPIGVTWQRNKTATGFLGIDGVTPVIASIDPFFFRTTEIEAVADFYVRDWTDTAAVHDRGQEPSVRANFYSTSDVWNQRVNDPLAFDASDRPDSHDPQPTATGHNFAFARVSREATGTAADVTLNYLYSDGGVGVNYVSAGMVPATLHFAAGDAQKSPAAGAGYQWELPSGASNHVCLAVEISTPTDPIIPPSLLGHAPGWPTTDLMVVNDNNKAQRNMHVFGFGGMAAGGAGQMSVYAIVHNAATFLRDVIVGIDIDPRHVRLLSGATLGAVGSQDRQPLRPFGTLTLAKMSPGENRWVELTFSPPPQTREAARVGIVELRNGVPVNGYSFLVKPMPVADAIRDTLLQHAAVSTRLAEAFGLAAGRDEAKAAQDVVATGKTDAATYGRFLREHRETITKLTNDFVEKAGVGDPLGATAAARRLAAGLSDPARAQPLHLALLEKLDAAQTMRRKADGDVADIPQNVRWQKDLFARQKELPRAHEVAEKSAAFLNEFEHRKVSIDGYPPLVEGLTPIFREAAATDTTGRAGRALDEVRQARSPVSLQKAHRTFLLALDGSVR